HENNMRSLPPGGQRPGRDRPERRHPAHHYNIPAGKPRTFAEHTMQPLISLNAVTRLFGAFTALSDITLSLPPGRIGLLGPNGAGKSTLLKILMGLIPPSSGTGYVLDQPLGGDRDTEGNWRLRRLIGFMPETDALVPGLTGIEYVSLAGELYGMPRREAQRRAHEVLSFLELEEARYRRVEEYLPGEEQRAELGPGPVHHPHEAL